jgi:hypothetical protein
MANFMLQSNQNFHRRNDSRCVVDPSSAQIRADAAMHDEIAERARTSRNTGAVTKVDASMSREEIIAKVMGSARRAVVSR